MEINEFDDFILNIKTYFIFEEPFLGTALINININEDNSIQTLNASFDTTTFKYEINYNYNFLKSLNEKKFIFAVFKHELLHILNKHHLRREEIRKKTGHINYEIANIAMDIAINQYIDNIPDNALHYSQYNQQPFQDFETYYFNIYNNKHKPIDNNKDINNKPNETKPQNKRDDTNLFNSKENKNHNELFKQRRNEELKDLMENSIDNINKETIKHNSNLIKNNPPKFIKDIMNITYKKKILNWKKFIKQFIDKEIISNDKESTIYRENRRFNNTKGKRKIKEFNLLIAIDTSFSIKKEEIFKFINEIYFLNKNLKPLIIYFTHEIYHQFSNFKNKKNLENIKRGGTDFQPIFDFAKSNNFQYIIILTDGYGEEEINTYGKKTIWINNKFDKICITRKKYILSGNLFQFNKTKFLS